ncbi:hypothetical protein MRX96_021531 [Rhipicephalus microplus]
MSLWFGRSSSFKLGISPGFGSQGRTVSPFIRVQKHLCRHTAAEQISTILAAAAMRPGVDFGELAYLSYTIADENISIPRFCSDTVKGDEGVGPKISECLLEKWHRPYLLS